MLRGQAKNTGCHNTIHKAGNKIEKLGGADILLLTSFPEDVVGSESEGLSLIIVVNILEMMLIIHSHIHSTTT